MRDTSAQTFIVPDALTATNPAPVARATAVPIRAVVRNTGAPLMFVGFATSDVSPGTGGSTSAAYRIPAGGETVFVLAPRQALFATAAGPGGQAVISVSDALPLV